MSSDEELDIHICGRCKVSFHSINEYYTHKKSKSCVKKKAIIIEPTVVDASLHYQQIVSDADSATVVFNIGTDEHEVVTGNDKPEAQSSVTNVEFSSPEVTGDVESLYQRKLRRRKSAPKKLWVEDYNLDHPDTVAQDKNVKHSNKGTSYACETSEAGSFKRSQHNNESRIPIKKRKTGNRSKEMSESKVCGSKEIKTTNESAEQSLVQEPACSSLLTPSDDDNLLTIDLSELREGEKHQPQHTTKKRKRGRPPRSEYTAAVKRVPPRPKKRQNVPRCPVCNDEFAHKEELDRHLRKIHNLSCYICKVCHKGFQDKYKLTRHEAAKLCNEEDKVSRNIIKKGDMVLQTLPPPITIDDCDNGLANEEEVVSQLLSPPFYKCFVCDNNWEKYEDITKHVLSHTDVCTAVCRFCGKWYSSKYKLLRHISSAVHDVVSEEDIAKARQEIQNMKFKTPSSGKSVSSWKMNSWQCEPCNERFDNKQKFMKHQSLHGNSSSRGYTCEECGDKFSKKSALIAHVKEIHKLDNQDDGQLTRCPVCKRKFQQKAHQQRHRAALHVAGRQVPAERMDQDDMQIDEKPSTDLDNETAPLFTVISIKKENREHNCKVKCFICCEFFNSNASFAMHMYNHKVWIANADINGPEPPDLIEDTFSTISDRMVPLINGVPNPKRPTGSVPKIDTNDSGSVVDNLSTQELSETHKATDPNDGHIPCPYCPEKFTSLTNLYSHKRDFHKLKEVWRCVDVQCREVFKDITSFKDHHSNVHPQESFICSICNEHLLDMNSIIVHKTSHRNTNPGEDKLHHTCAKCQMKFFTKEQYNDHLGSEHLTCYACDKSFDTVDQVQGHLLTHKVARTHLCDTCGDTFANSVSLSRHKALHNPKKVLECPHCGRNFNKNEYLKRHILCKHSKAKPYKCKVEGCDRAFNRKDKLKEHTKSHSTARPFKCNICGRLYKYKEGLRYHAATHDRKIKFPCNHCEVAFPRPGMLRDHLAKVHSIQMKSDHIYQCKFCAATFSRPERYNRHLEREHDSEVSWSFRCDICKKGFPGEASLLTHKRFRHRPKTTVEEKKPKPAKSKTKQVNEKPAIIPEIHKEQSLLQNYPTHCPPDAVSTEQMDFAIPATQTNFEIQNDGSGHHGVRQIHPQDVQIESVSNTIPVQLLEKPENAKQSQYLTNVKIPLELYESMLKSGNVLTIQPSSKETEKLENQPTYTVLGPADNQTYHSVQTDGFNRPNSGNPSQELGANMYTETNLPKVVYEQNVSDNPNNPADTNSAHTGLGKVFHEKSPNVEKWIEDPLIAQIKEAIFPKVETVDNSEIISITGIPVKGATPNQRHQIVGESSEYHHIPPLSVEQHHQIQNRSLATNIDSIQEIHRQYPPNSYQGKIVHSTQGNAAYSLDNTINKDTIAASPVTTQSNVIPSLPTLLYSVNVPQEHNKKPGEHNSTVVPISKLQGQYHRVVNLPKTVNTSVTPKPIYSQGTQSVQPITQRKVVQDNTYHNDTAILLQKLFSSSSPTKIKDIPGPALSTPKKKPTKVSTLKHVPIRPMPPANEKPVAESAKLILSGNIQGVFSPPPLPQNVTPIYYHPIPISIEQPQATLVPQVQHKVVHAPKSTQASVSQAVNIQPQYQTPSAASSSPSAQSSSFVIPIVSLAGLLNINPALLTANPSLIGGVSASPVSANIVRSEALSFRNSTVVTLAQTTPITSTRVTQGYQNHPANR